MASTVAWMDTSAEEQRRVREMIALFAQQESRDELGMGQIRDVISDLLFPGTSVLQTRARYFLLIPWGYQVVMQRGRPKEVDAKARELERRLVDLLIKSDDRGVIGRRVGASVKNLPSTLFWSGLVTYGILTRDASPEQLTGALLTAEDADELVDRRRGEWHPTLPPIPERFPWSMDDGTGLKPLDLRAGEAQWLQERMVEASRGTLLEYLVQAGSAPDPRSGAPWEDRICLKAPEVPAGVLQHARAFSLLVQGASLIYNLLVARAYEEAGFDRVEAPVDRYLDEYARWLTRANSMNRFRDWDLATFWGLISSRPNRISPRSRAFVDNVTASVRVGDADMVLDDPRNSLWSLVSSRERSIKGSQSRLGDNRKLLGAWSGASGIGRLTFRWTQVRGIVTDVQEGLARA